MFEKFPSRGTPKSIRVSRTSPAVQVRVHSPSLIAKRRKPREVGQAPHTARQRSRGGVRAQDAGRCGGAEVYALNNARRCCSGKFEFGRITIVEGAAATRRAGSAASRRSSRGAQHQPQGAASAVAPLWRQCRKNLGNSSVALAATVSAYNCGAFSAMRMHLTQPWLSSHTHAYRQPPTL